MTAEPSPAGSASAADAGLSWPALLTGLTSGQDLPAEATAWAMHQIMSGDAEDSHIAAFLAALRTKGETVQELAGLVSAMLDHAVPMPGLEDSVDIVGTGGDGARTVNISSTAALIAAAAGVRVVKHGNRAASSASGSADVLEALGVDLSLRPEQSRELAERTGIAFLFATTFHPAFRFAGPVRKQLAIPTAFNLLGPLTNPARVTASAIGVADAARGPLIAGVLAESGRRALVFHSRDGLDELSTTAPNDVWEVRDGTVQHSSLDARDLGLARVTKDALRGGDPAQNAEVTRRVLTGERSAVRDIVLLNAAAALVAYAPEAGTPLAARLQDALRAAEEAVDSGAAARKLAALAQVSTELGQAG
ncbi:anthranilate phosphoribosyltransferase [Sediminivirga luteola]|uniref:Anthranilate phosphoribosyltransferase n=1 Tax=Sediminivirga luteola TaxID=1774748 RepID=A0A8J2XJV4_9MICO|nr:anthranilate phosphoribosyltransferase [Sediminivirga luteola]MCI2264035.1 anthranilate phosphoribosyltransferase [Sediminivirga luteola]GGA22882.1 anthranilate phosphoribosyltransferase 1 [Sediminivirga luteola]